MDRSEQIGWMCKEAANVGLSLSAAQSKSLLRYYEMLVEANKVMNLTAITDFEDVVRKHFADSLMLSKHVVFHNIHRLIDIGTGAGFPGLVLKICYPHLSVTLLDSLAKRIHFLESVSCELGLSEITFLHARTEDAAQSPIHREKYDLAVSRAVASLNVLSEYCLPYVRTGGYFVAYKSGDVEEEIRNADRALSVLGGSLERIEGYPLFDMRRSLVFVRKEKKTPKQYPRKAGTPSKKPL